MKYLHFILAFLCLSLGAKAQNIRVEDDFEGNGTISTWYGDACYINTGLINPYQTGINTSATVLEYIDSGGQYANVRFDVIDNHDIIINNLGDLTVGIYIIVFNSGNYIQSYRLIKE